jgi:hypothetical protein
MTDDRFQPLLAEPMIMARVLRLFAFCAVIVLGGGVVSAQPVSTTVSSIEWATAQACIIVRATIDSVSVHELKDGLYPNQGVRRFQTVSIHVRETLRGEHEERLQFVHDGDFSTFRLADLQARKQEMLLFLDSSLRGGEINRATGEYAYTRFPLKVASAIVLDADRCRWTHTSVPVLSADLKRVNTPRQTIEAVKLYLKSHQGDEASKPETKLLPPELRGGFHQATLMFPPNAGPNPPGSKMKPPLLGFEQFEEQFSKPPPAERKPSYSRKGTGAISVYALEVMAADSDVIVRGIVEKSCFVSRVDGPTGDSFAAEVRVIESIKGETNDRISCFISDAGDLDKLQRDKREVVFFLRNNKTDRVADPRGVLEFRTRGGHWDDSAIVLDKTVAEVLFEDLTWRHEPAEILHRLRSVVRKPDGANDDANVKKGTRRMATRMGENKSLALFRFHPPTSIAADSSIAGNPNSRVYLSLNSDLQENARKWASAESQDLRWVAARALVYFRSDENADVLMKLLDDNATWERREMLSMTGLPYPYEPEFLVRWEAWHVLAGWGYDVPRPAFGRR